MSKSIHFIGQPLLGQILSFIDHAEVLRISKEHGGEHYVKHFDDRHHLVDFRKFLKAEAYISGKKMVHDGTKIKAYASKNTLSLQSINKRMEQLKAQLDQYLAQLQENDIVKC